MGGWGNTPFKKLKFNLGGHQHYQLYKCDITFVFFVFCFALTECKVLSASISYSFGVSRQPNTTGREAAGLLIWLLYFVLLSLSANAWIIRLYAHILVAILIALLCFTKTASAINFLNLSIVFRKQSCLRVFKKKQFPNFIRFLYPYDFWLAQIFSFFI